MRILLTGGAGFIGSAVARYIIENTTHDVLVYDKLTYAGNPNSLAPIALSGKFKFIQGDGEDIYTTKESQRLLRMPLFYGLDLDSVKRVVDVVYKFFSIN